MKKNKAILNSILFLILISLFIIERYTAEKPVDESRVINTKTSQSPLSKHSRGIEYLRNHSADQLNSILNEMRASGQPIYEDEIIPQFDPSLHNAVTDFKAIMEILGKAEKGSALYGLNNLWKRTSALTKEDMAKITELLEDDSVSELIDLARKTAEKDYIDFGLDYSMGPNLVLPHLTHRRHLMKVLSLKSFVESQNGRNEDAVNILNIALKLNSMPSDDVTMIGELVENASSTILSENIMALKSSGSDLSGTYKLLEASLEMANQRQLRTIDGERHFFGSWIYERLISSENTEELKSLGIEGLQISPQEAKDHYIDYLRSMMDVRELMEEPYHVNSSKMKEIIKKSENSIFLSQMLPAYDKIYKNFHKSQTTLKKNLLALKVEEYKEQHGVEPETLQDLNVPQDYLIDSVTGNPFLLIDNTGGSRVITHLGDETGQKL